MYSKPKYEENLTKKIFLWLKIIIFINLGTKNKHKVFLPSPARLLTLPLMLLAEPERHCQIVFHRLNLKKKRFHNNRLNHSFINFM